MTGFFDAIFGSNGGQMHGRNWQTNQTIPSNPVGPPGPRYSGASSYSAFAAQQQAVNDAMALYKAMSAAGINTASVEPEPIEDAGIRAGEITAWRCWRYDSGLLRSAFTETIWAPSEPMTGSIGKGGHGNGVHAWKTLSKALEYGLGKRPVIIGQVELWGEIVEHEHGYRSEFAAISSLDSILGAGQDALTRLRTLYKVGGRDDLAIEEPVAKNLGVNIEQGRAALRLEFPDWDTVAPRVAAFAERVLGCDQTHLATLYDPVEARSLYQTWAAAGRP